MIPDLRIEDFDYELPESRIAKYPLAERDASKLLVYKDGTCNSDTFRNISAYLPPCSTMVFNDTKVVPARLFFRKSSGAKIELFCLEPYAPTDYAESFASTRHCSWKCVIGNAKRWKEGALEYVTSDSVLAAVRLRAVLLQRDGQTGIVEFSWDGGESFSTILEMCGRVPIPPYLNRDTEDIDQERYQTEYARVRGSVAAPTAGLHFTSETLASLKNKEIEIRRLCLHVGAGTFLPVKQSAVSEHHMHRESFMISLQLLRELAEKEERHLTAVGTTSVRTLESLYYAGASCLENGRPEDVPQWAPYKRNWPYSTRESLQALVDYMERRELGELALGTSIIIVPGFKFRLTDALVTNFHQPKSTLLLLVSAFVGGDWQNIYSHAMNDGFRFLSYGDSSLLFRR